MWQVRRHSGRADGRWRVVLETADEERARRRFEQEALRLRQGGVRLYDPQEVMVAAVWAPRLRTRW